MTFLLGLPDSVTQGRARFRVSSATCPRPCSVVLCRPGGGIEGAANEEEGDDDDEEDDDTEEDDDNEEDNN